MCLYVYMRIVSSLVLGVWEKKGFLVQVGLRVRETSFALAPCSLCYWLLLHWLMMMTVTSRDSGRCSKRRTSHSDGNHFSPGGANGGHLRSLTPLPWMCLSSSYLFFFVVNEASSAFDVIYVFFLFFIIPPYLFLLTCLFKQ